GGAGGGTGGGEGGGGVGKVGPQPSLGVSRGGRPVGRDAPPPPHAATAVVVQLGGHRGLARSRGRLRRLGGRAGGRSGLSRRIRHGNLMRRANRRRYSGLSFAALTTSRRR